MASYRSFRGSKGTLGPCRAVCLWRVGLNPAGALPFRIRTGAFRADFVASKKVRFRWLPTGVLRVQRVR